MTPQAAPSSVRLLYFLVGIVATLAYRAIIVLEAVSGVWVRVAWYVGTIGFIVYFAHRAAVSARRVRIIREQRLDEKVATGAALAVDDRAALAYILTTLESTKERWNSIIIFAASGVALVVGLVLDLTG